MTRGPTAPHALTSRRAAAREESRKYGRFWSDVGEHFPDLGGAASTRLYADDERRLLTEHVPNLATGRLFKTDLWDEAKNTRILAWAQSQGARVFGIDISPPTLRAADGAFASQAGLALGDVRQIPFADGSFDAVYSMGTVEHFDETEQALQEIGRVLRPGGIAIVGVPNRWDPFLRPLLVAALRGLGLYGYGYEKSYSRRRLRRMMIEAGFQVTAETGILFLPGWLRMLDLFFHAYRPGLQLLTRPLVSAFEWLGRELPVVRRYGYLLATVGVKPAP